MELKLSASQIKSFQQSPRYWALEKLEGCPRVGSPYMKIGSDIHKGLEGAWPEDVEMPEYVSKCVVEWDKVKDDLVDNPICEEYITREFFMPDLKDNHKIVLRGYIDVLDVQEDTVVIIDHKSSGTGSTFHKQPEDLLNDIQLRIYSEWALSEFDKENVKVIHAQYKYRNKKKILNILEANFTRDDQAGLGDGILDDVEPILRVAKDYNVGDWRGLEHGESRWPHEFDMINSGQVSIERYKEVFAGLVAPVYREDIVDALKEDIKSLANKEIDDILRLASGEGQPSRGECMIINLTDVVKKARDNNSGIKNKWDNIDAVVEATVGFLLEKKDLDLVMIPSHFNIDADYDYKKIITLLKENDIKVGKWV